MGAEHSGLHAWRLPNTVVTVFVIVILWLPFVRQHSERRSVVQFCGLSLVGQRLEQRGVIQCCGPSFEK